MAIQPQRTRWPDERLDDLNQVVREGFARVERETQDLRVEMNDRFDRVDSRLTQVDDRFDRVDSQLTQVDDRFDRTDDRFNRMDDRFDRMDERFDHRFDELSGQFHALQQVMIIGLFGLSGSILAAVVAALLKFG